MSLTIVLSGCGGSAPVEESPVEESPVIETEPVVSEVILPVESIPVESVPSDPVESSVVEPELNLDETMVPTYCLKLPARVTVDPFKGTSSSFKVESDGSLVLTFYPLDPALGDTMLELPVDAGLGSDSESVPVSSEEVGTVSYSVGSEGTLKDVLIGAVSDALVDALTEAIMSSLVGAAESTDIVASELPNSLLARYKFQFPSGYVITQESGLTAGTSIVSSTVVLDTFDLLLEYDGEPFVFRASKPSKRDLLPADVVSPFEDVPTSLWCFRAVYDAYLVGAAESVDEGIFAPDANITIAQMCQLLAKTAGLETGEYGGYWAAGAITSCLDYGIIFSHGPLLSAVYDLPVTRQEAVSAMTRTYALMNELNLEDSPCVKLSAIPDGALVYDEYSHDVCVGYALGIVSGRDSIGTLGPLDTLTRAEMCQLVWNAGMV